MNIGNKKYGVILLALSFMFLTLGISTAASTQCNLIPSTNYFKIISTTWGNSTHVISAGPGLNDVPITVTLENFGGSCTFIDLKGYLELYGGITNFNGSSYSTYYINSLPPYSLFNMVFNVNIAKNLSVGKNTTMSFPFYISWNYTNDTIRSTQEYNLTVPLYGSPDLSFSIKNQPLIAGELNNITLQVQNSGSGYSYYLSPKISLSSGGILSQPATINSIAPDSYENTTFMAYIPSSYSGQPIPFTLNYNYISPYGYNTSVSEVVSTYAIPNYNDGLSLSLENTSIESGNIQNTSIVAYDSTNYPIENLTLTITPSSTISLIKSDGIIKFPEIKPHSEVSVPISLYLTPSSGSVGSISSATSYILNGQPETSTLLLNFLTPSDINLVNLNTVFLPSNPTAGSLFTLTSTLNNMGSGTASSVFITPKPQQGISVVGQNTTSLGSIPVATPTAFTLSFTTSPSIKPGVYKIPVVVSYSNNLNQQINQTIDFSVNISKGLSIISAASGNQSATQNAASYQQYRRSTGGIPVFLIVIILIIIVVIVYLFRRMRKKNASKKAKVHQ